MNTKRNKGLSAIVVACGCCIALSMTNASYACSQQGSKCTVTTADQAECVAEGLAAASQQIIIKGTPTCSYQKNIFRSGGSCKLTCL